MTAPTPRMHRSPDAPELLRMRHRLDDLDGRIVRLLAERRSLSQQARRVKDGLHLPPVDPAREARVVSRAAHSARDLDLDAELVRDIYWRILRLSREVR